MLDVLKNHLRDNFSFINEKKLLICVSGGVDSMVLAYLFRINNKDDIPNWKVRNSNSHYIKNFRSDFL